MISFISPIYYLPGNFNVNILTRAVRNPPNTEASEKVVGLFTCDPARIAFGFQDSQK